MRVWPLGQEDALEKEMATHSSTLAWRIPQTEEPGDYSPWGRKESDMAKQLNSCQLVSPGGSTVSRILGRTTAVGP